MYKLMHRVCAYTLDFCCFLCYETAGLITMLNSSKCAVSAKEVPFGGLDNEK